MTSIKSYFNGKQILEAMHQKWWYFVINFIALFFAHPVVYLLQYSGIEKNVANYSSTGDYTYLARLENFVRSFFSMGSNMAPVLIVMIFSAAFSSVVMFAYLHNRKEINFMHSLPVRRESLFVSNYLAGAAAFILPLLGNMAIAVCCSAATGTLGYLSAGSYILAILQVILFYFVNYTLATVAAHLAGTVFAHICGVLVLNFIAFFTYMVHYMLSDIFFATFVGDSQSRLLLRLSPYIRTFSILNEPLTLFEGGLYAVFTALLIGGCLWLYQRRPSEKSGTPLIFDCSKPVFKYLIVLWGTAYMGLFFYAISGIGFMLFGFVAGGFLTHMACEVVFQKDFKSMLKNKLGLLAFLAAFGVVFCVYYFDMTGFDTYIPNEASVESITFTDGLENSYYYTTGPNAKMKEPYSDPEEMASILQIARLSVEYREQNQTTDGLGRRQAAPVALSQKYAANNLNITISYQLKSGRNVQRRYTSVPLVVVKEPFEGLYNTRRYIENSSSLFLRDETYPLSRMEITSTINKSEAKYLERDKNTLTEEQSRKLMEAMKQDALKRTFADMQTYHQVFMVTTSYEVKDQNGRQQYYANAEIPVYENDAATIAVLTRDFGMRDPKETYQVLLSSIGQIELYRYEDLNAAEYVQKAKAGILDQESTIAPVVILDPAQIAEIMDCSILAGRYRNTVALTDGSISAVIVMKNGASSEAMSYYDYNNDKNQGGYRLSLLIRQDKLPSFAEALLNR